MSGIDSSAPAIADRAPDGSPLLNFSVHSPPSVDDAVDSRRTARGRLVMVVVLLCCAAPVVASYLAYFVVRPQGRTNYGDLVAPARPLPAALPLSDLRGARVDATSLRGQWLLLVVAGGACDAACERSLWLQRQLHEALGREKERVEKLWLVDDAAAPREATLRAIVAAGTSAPAGMAPARVLRTDRAALARWLEPAPGHALEDHIYIVDPRGDWMMRAPADADPARLKRDIDKLLRASAGWDQAGR